MVALSIGLIALAVSVDVASGLIFGYRPVLTFVLHDLPFRGETFDPGIWSVAGSCAGLSDGDCFDRQAACSRGGMVRDLITEHLTPGDASRGTVASLIGTPEYDVRIEGQSCDGYALDMCSGQRWDYNSL